jgi:hypothetical protein
MRSFAVLLTAIAVVFAFGACKSNSGPTPIIIVVTPSPSPEVTPTEEPTATPTGEATETPTEEATPTAVLTPVPGGYHPATDCSGSPDNQNFYQSAADGLSVDIYCPVFPAGWYVNGTASWHGNPAAQLVAPYKGPGGATITIKEGAFCTAGASACAPKDTIIGAAVFGDRAGTLVSLGPGAGYAIYVDANSTHAYEITGNGLTQANFVAIAAALIKVAKS